MLQPKNYRTSSQNLCDVCRKEVTNPICPSCISTELEAWLVLYPNLKKELMPKIKNFICNIKNKFNTTTCNQCGNKGTAICPYCLTDYILKHLKKINSNKIIFTEFFNFFNLDFHHTQYKKEAEKLGLL